MIFLEMISNEDYCGVIRVPRLQNDDLATTFLKLSDTVRVMRIDAFLFLMGYNVSIRVY